MKPAEPSITFDPEADAAYVALRGAAVARTHEVADGIIVDFSLDDQVVGVEILWVSARVGSRDRHSYLLGLVEGLLTPRRQAAE